MRITVETTEPISITEAIRRLTGLSRQSLYQAAGLAANTYKKTETGEYCSRAHAQIIVCNLVGELDHDLASSLEAGETFRRFELRPLPEDSVGKESNEQGNAPGRSL